MSISRPIRLKAVQCLVTSFITIIPTAKEPCDVTPQKRNFTRETKNSPACATFLFQYDLSFLKEKNYKFKIIWLNKIETYMLLKRGFDPSTIGLWKRWTNIVEVIYAWCLKNALLIFYTYRYTLIYSLFKAY